MSDAGKTLLLSSAAPGHWTTGGRFLQQMLNTLSLQNSALILINGDKYVAPPALAAFNLPLPPSPRIYETETPPTKAEEIVYWLFRQRFFNRLEEDIAKLSDFAGGNQVSHIVAVLDHPAVIWITKKLAESLKVKYSTFTSVMPETALLHDGYDSSSKLQVLKRYIDTLKGAYAVGFASQQMATSYEEKYSVNGIEIGLSAEDLQLNQNVADSASIIRIGSLINVKYMQATQALIAGCQQISWTVSNKRIALKLIGSASRMPFNFAGKPAEVEILGGLTDKETVQSLSECTINFLPYWTEQQFSETTRLCLPDEFPFYAAAQRPIMAYCTEESLVGDIVKGFSLGESLVSCSEKMFISTLQSLLDTTRIDMSRKGFARLRQEKFSQSLFVQGIKALLPSSCIEENSNV